MREVYKGGGAEAKFMGLGQIVGDETYQKNRLAPNQTKKRVAQEAKRIRHLCTEFEKLGPEGAPQLSDVGHRRAELVEHPGPGRGAFDPLPPTEET